MIQSFLQRSPFVRAVIPLATGIWVAHFLVPESGDLFVSVVLVLFLIAAVTAFRGGFLRNALSGAIFSLFFLICGMAVYTLQSRKPFLPVAERYLARLEEIPEKRVSGFRAEVTILAAITHDSVISHRERVMVYFSAADSLMLPGTGQIITFSEFPADIVNDSNPYGFDYSGYMKRRRIFRQVRLKPGEWSVARPGIHYTAGIRAEMVRSRLIAVYEKGGLSGDQLSVLSALTLGYRKNLDPEVRQTFSNSGAMHVLAVSGLHVGIIFLAFRLVFSFLKRSAGGRVVFLAGAISVLWGYAFITGMSPSVQRAALMFSLVQVADMFRRPVNIYNTLAASAFLLLFFKPALLFEVGFQLSYSAVLGIVYFQPKMSGLINTRSRLAGYFRDLLTVSVAAQLGTFAFSSYYFNQFPVWFWITNLIVIPGAFLLIMLAAGTLFLSFIPVLSSGLAFLAGEAVGFMLEFLKWVESLPGSVYSGFFFNEVSLFVFLMALFMMVMFVESKRKAYLFMLYGLAILFSVNRAVMCYTLNSGAELIVYRHHEPLLHIIDGQENYLLVREESVPGFMIPFPVQNVLKAKNLGPPHILPFDATYCGSSFLIGKNMLVFGSRVIALPGAPDALIRMMTPDFIMDFPGRRRFSDLSGNSVRIVFRNSLEEGMLPAYELSTAGALRIRL
jgi:competence protein ComEC